MGRVAPKALAFTALAPTAPHLPRSRGFSFSRVGRTEHVPEKLNDFSDKNMLQFIDLERFPIGWNHPIGKRSSTNQAARENDHGQGTEAQQ